MSKIKNILVLWSIVLVFSVGMVAAQEQAAPQTVPDPAPPPPAVPAATPATAAGSGTQRPVSNLSSRRNRVSRTPVRDVPAGAGMAAGTTLMTPETDSDAEAEKSNEPALKFEDSSSDFLLRAYAEETGKTLLVSPDLPKVGNINLRSQEGVPLTREEFLEAIEVTLSMNGIILELYGDKFLKVLPRKTIRTEGIKITMEQPEGGHPEKNKIVSQMVQLKYITISEAQKALEGFKRPDGMIQAFERTNSLLVTDTQENVNRMLEIVQFVDQPIVATEEVNVRMVRYAKAEDIKKRLEEIVAESQKQSQAKEEIKANVSGAPGFTRTAGVSPVTGRPLPPGLQRLGARGAAQQAAAATPEPNVSIETLISDADRGMIRGKVQIIADERSNQLIIITREENMNFFDKVINVLDIETAPDVVVEVQRLEYADAEEVSSMLNDLIGNVSSKKDDSAPVSTARPGGDTADRSASLSQAAAARARRTAATEKVGEESAGKLGQLSKDNIKILADKRTNAIVVMGSPNDVRAIQTIIASMDIKLSQVLIETVVVQVELGDEFRTGVDWVKRVTERGNYRFSTAGGGGSVSPTNLFGTLTSGSAATSNLVENAIATGANVLGKTSGLSYVATFKDLKLDAFITAVKTDSHSKVLSSPVLMTVDNKEATLEATQMRYLYKGVRYSGSTYEGREVPDYEQRDIGLTVKITPRINPNGSVMLEIDETFETIGAPQELGGEPYPTINTRKVQADIAVENMETVILGGLVQSDVTDSRAGIPILKDIPFIGKYIFSSRTRSEARSELLVFITPYVLDNKQELEAEARRRKAALHDARPWDDAGWSASRLADPLTKKEVMEREKREWQAEDQDKKAAIALKEAQRRREEMLKRREKSDANRELRWAKEDLRNAEKEERRLERDTTEDELRVLLHRLKEKQEQEADVETGLKPEVTPVPEISAPRIKVEESVEVIGKLPLAEQPAAPAAEPVKPPVTLPPVNEVERLLAP